MKRGDVPSPAAKWTNPAKAEYGSDGVTAYQLGCFERRWRESLQLPAIKTDTTRP
jgi:hypothetical protein